ncbi:galactose oxidase-like domain-containing protein [Actinosynnema sp. NPDC051121]
MVAGAGLVTARAAVASTDRPTDRPRPDTTSPSLTVRPERLLLKIDNTVSPPAPGEAVPLLISTTSSRRSDLRITSETANTTVGLNRQDAVRERGVDVQVKTDAPVTVWVVPHKVGPHSEPGDWITVSDGHDSVRVEVWIEPTGGQWTTQRPDGTLLELDIVAIHAALVRGPNDCPEVVMYSTPRERDPHGNLVTDAPDQVDQWYWNADEMGPPEARTLELENWTTTDVNPWHDPDVHNNIFCSGASHMPDGRLLVVGGHVHEHVRGCSDHEDPQVDNGRTLHLYDPEGREHRWVKLPAQLKETRCYPTVTPLPDGRMLISSGSGEGLWYSDREYFCSIQNSYVIYDGHEIGDEKTLVEVDGGLYPPLATYPGVFVLPGDGGDPVVAVVETHRAWLYRYDSAGKALERAGGPRCMTSPGSRSYPWYGSMVLLPLHPCRSARAILAVGGTRESNTDYTDVVGEGCTGPEAEGVAEEGTARTAQLLEFDVSEPLAETGCWKSLPTSQARFLNDATLLADGTVLVSGGARQGWANHNEGPVNQAELFDPEAKTFRAAATAETERRYHSVALLLPDGTVLKAGSNGGFGGPKGVEGQSQAYFRSQSTGERYLPPYLWRGPRPVIDEVLPPSPTAGTRTVRHGQEITVIATGSSLDADSKAALIRLGAATHGNNMEQRYVWLETSVRDQADGKATLHVTTPDNGAAAPPGDYMLVVVDGNGVPSEAKLVRISA